MKKDAQSNLTVLVIGIIVLVVGGYFVWNQYGKPKAPATSQAQVEQAKQLLDDVGKLILLPKGEDPIFATINDATALAKAQPFYTGSKNGDIVIIYQKAAKAIIYSPSRNLIVNVGPILPQPLTQSSSPATTTKK